VKPGRNAGSARKPAVEGESCLDGMGLLQKRPKKDEAPQAEREA